jgi:hypothetical protein
MDRIVNQVEHVVAETALDQEGHAVPPVVSSGDKMLRGNSCFSTTGTGTIVVAAVAPTGTSVSLLRMYPARDRTWMGIQTAAEGAVNGAGPVD